MHFYGNVFAITICVTIEIARIPSQFGFAQENSAPEKYEELTSVETYSFLALIDVVFTEGSKKTCTGTIIHDNVVITAAHCFSEDDEKAELTASFVVIGTKKMFDTGYEQYLPIERVIIHPNYKGWTADLALVFTFAGMMSDKPGRVIRLASETTSTPDSDVTVYSWGCCLDEVLATARDTEPASDEDDNESKGKLRTRKTQVTSFIGIHSNVEDENDRLSAKNKMLEGKMTSKSKHRKNKKKSKRQKYREPSSVAPTKNKKSKRVHKIRKTTKYIISSDEEDAKFSHYPETYKNLSNFNTEEDRDSWEREKEYLKKAFEKPVDKEKKENRVARKKKTHYDNNWRRTLGNQRNTLTSEVFGFVNMQTCSKLVEKTMPSLYEIKNPNEVLCYANEAFYITEEDSGAPALRQGRLVAVTVGGINYGGERVAVGMKMICFCAWIADNLPQSGHKIECCKKCCETKKEEEQSLRHIHKKKKYRNVDINISKK